MLYLNLSRFAILLGWAMMLSGLFISGFVLAWFFGHLILKVPFVIHPEFENVWLGCLFGGAGLMAAADVLERKLKKRYDVFYVVGGVYTDFTWTKLEDGMAEKYGPFQTYEEARVKWLEVARFKVDNACHRLTIATESDLPKTA